MGTEEVLIKHQLKGCVGSEDSSNTKKSQKDVKEGYYDMVFMCGADRFKYGNLLKDIDNYFYISCVFG